MHAADEIIPRLPRGELANPIFVAGQVIHFEREADLELWKFFLCAADFGDVFIQLTVRHAPVIEVIAGHGRMVREANFREADFHRVPRVIHWFTRRMAAERRMHMQISGQRHGGEFRVLTRKFQARMRFEFFTALRWRDVPSVRMPDSTTKQETKGCRLPIVR